MTFGKRLQKLRKEKGYTLNELANKFNKSKSTFSSYENDRRKPDIDLIKDLANYFNVTIDYLLTNSSFRYDPKEKISKVLEDDPELLEFWEVLKERDDLQLMLKQTRDLPEDAIQDILRIIMRIEKEEGTYGN